MSVQTMCLIFVSVPIDKNIDFYELSLMEIELNGFGDGKKILRKIQLPSVRCLKDPVPKKCLAPHLLSILECVTRTKSFVNSSLGTTSPTSYKLTQL